MASLLRQIVAGPRARHPEAGLDLCYVTDNIIATSGPSGTYPQLAYRNPLKQLVKFLDDKHGDQWAIWEFRAEGTGYPDEEVYDRIYHFPWPDHHPPPFALIPLIVASMRNWLKGESLQRPPQPYNQNDSTASTVGTDGEQLSKKLEAVNLEQQQQIGRPVLVPGNGDDIPPLPPIKDTEPASHAAQANDTQVNESIDPPSETSTLASTPETSGTSTPKSSRRKKIVRWRESTLLPPKEVREKLSAENLSGSEGAPPKDKETKSKKKGEKEKKKKPERVVVVHCKAGKGRSGTVSCSYLISQEGWTAQAALSRFTERRMRPGFGAGVSIPSQLRWVSYVDRWTRHGKKYTDRPLEIVAVHVWGLRDRVKVCIEGFKEDGRKIEAVHRFSKEEREIARGNGTQKGPGFAGIVSDLIMQEKARRDKVKNSPPDSPAAGDGDVAVALDAESQKSKTTPENLAEDGAGGDVVFRPQEKVILDTNDVNIDFERRNKGVSNLSMITSVAHVWFNAYFEGDGPELNGQPREEGVFEIEWDRMDGIKGSSRKGTRAFDRLAVVWRSVTEAPAKEVREPKRGEMVKDVLPADWTGAQHAGDERELGVSVDTSSQVSLDKDFEAGKPVIPAREVVA